MGILMEGVWGGCGRRAGWMQGFQGVDYRNSEQRWWEGLELGGQRAEDLSVDRDGLGPIGTAIIPAAAICPSPGQDTQSLSRI